MMASTLKWRLDTNLDSLLENGDLGNGKQIPKYIENFDENGKVFTLGTNHKNQPVMYVQFGKHVIWAQPQATTKKCARRWVPALDSADPCLSPQLSLRTLSLSDCLLSRPTTKSYVAPWRADEPAS